MEVVPSDQGCGTLMGFHTGDAISDASAVMALRIIIIKKLLFSKSFNLSSFHIYQIHFVSSFISTVARKTL